MLCALLTANSFAAPVIATEPFVRDAVAQLDAKIATNANAFNGFLPLSGGTMTGDVNAGARTITNLADPVNDTDAATRQWVVQYIQQIMDTSGKTCGASQYLNGDACASCTDACITNQTCTPVGPMNGIYAFDANSGIQNRSATCNNPDGNKDTAPSCPAWGQCTGGTAASCMAGYYKNGTTCDNCAGTCSTSQQCTPIPSGFVATYTADSGTQTRGANCTNATGNSETNPVCENWGQCTGGTIESCVANYYKSNTTCAACNGGFSASAGSGLATDCTRACGVVDISGSYAVSGTINQTQTPSTDCTLTSCVAGHYKTGNTCTSCVDTCASSQSCTPSPSGGVASYVTNSGLQTRSATCINGNGNTDTSATCAPWGACGGGTAASCASGYVLRNGACLVDGITSASVPEMCDTYWLTGSDLESFISEKTVSSCSGGNADGQPISTYVVGGYCDSAVGIGNYLSPVAQDCPTCVPAGASPTTNSYCYCKLVSINNLSLASTKFLHHGNMSSYCSENCGKNCVLGSSNNQHKSFASLIFSSVGS